MIYEGRTLHLDVNGDGVAALVFESTVSPVNKFDADTLGELREAIDTAREHGGVRAMVLSSALDAFVVGADITRFSTVFSQPRSAFEQDMRRNHRLFADIEDLPFPTVAAIGGLALGGGFEICLACDYRVMAADTRVGLPEINLGIFPGWGGSVRLPRLIGVEAAVQWIADGRPRDAGAALAAGAVDRVVPGEELLATARRLALDSTADDVARRRGEKREAPLPDDGERAAMFEVIRTRYAKALDPHYPALSIVLDAMEQHTALARDDALRIEADAFVDVARTPTAASLVGLFLNDQLLKKQVRRTAGDAPAVAHVGVIGSGIMGGGIAFACALAGVEVSLHDASRAALDRAMARMDDDLRDRVSRARMDEQTASAARGRVRACADLADLSSCDLVIEAVVEEPGVKAAVLEALAAQSTPDRVIASNTSTIAIDRLARSVPDPGRLVGLHFFNPVTVMPLVEVIRGAATRDDVVSRAVAFALRLRKHPVVVRDGPGFLVNRVLFPYLFAFEQLVHEGVDFARIDGVMESFGWPMGPARLLDVVGIDTSVYAARIMAEGYPDRMALAYTTPSERLVAAGRLGEKSGAGYYAWSSADGGRARATDDPATREFVGAGTAHVEDDDIIARMMVPMCIELARCLEEGVVDSAPAADMALVRGIGFPRYLGGALRYVDRVGADAFCKTADRFAHLGAAYHPTDALRRMAADGAKYFPDNG